MKKILSLALVAVMLLATLTGCDASDALQDLLNPTEPSGNTPTEPNRDVRTTVTLEEFMDAVNAQNFTYNVIANDPDAGYAMTLHIKVTSVAFYMSESITDSADQSEVERYAVTTDNGDVYLISKTESGYVAETGNATIPTFGEVCQFISASTFDELVYDAESKSYKFELQYDNGDKMAIEISFENGKIKALHMTAQEESAQASYDAYDFGTTVVELPEYTIAPEDSQ